MTQQIVDGKTLNEWCESPYGAFAKAVRDSGLDPLFGRFEPRADETKQSYEVTVQYSYSGTETVSYKVEAFNADEARELAEIEFQEDQTLEGEEQEHSHTYEPKLLNPRWPKKQFGGWHRSRNMRPTGTAAELQRRRTRAIELMNQGESPTVIARILGVCRTSLYRWKKMAQATPEGLAAKPHPGPKPRLTAEQLTELETLLLQGATKHGWPNILWTAQRVAEMIRRHFGVKYHVEHVRSILRHRLRWSSQKPQKKAKQRNNEKIDH